MPITEQELTVALNQLAAKNPGALIQAIATAAQVPVSVLQGAIGVGAKGANVDKGRKLLEQAQAHSASLLASLQDQITEQRQKYVTPLEVKLSVKQSAHASTLASIDALIDQLNAGQQAELPTWEELKAILEAE